MERAQTIKLSQESIGIHLCDLGFGSHFLGNQKHSNLRKKKTNWTLTKLKTSVDQKTPSRKWRSLQNGRKYLQILSDKGFVSSTKEHLKLNNKKTRNSVFQMGKKWANGLNSYVSKFTLQMASMPRKRWSTSLDVRERQVRATMRHHCTLPRMAEVKTDRYPPATGRTQGNWNPPIRLVGMHSCKCGHCLCWLLGERREEDPAQESILL